MSARRNVKTELVMAGVLAADVVEVNAARFTFMEETAGASVCFPMTSVPAPRYNKLYVYMLQ